MSKGVRAVLGLVVIAGVVAAVKFLPVTDSLLSLVDWVKGSGAVGVVVYAVVYIAATVLFLPGSVLTLGAGFVYGTLLGTLLVSPVSVIAATIAFVLGRTVARDWVAAKVAGNRRFAAVDRAVGESGFKIVALLRLSPVFPFNLLNYGLGLTAVRLRDYVLASFLGMLPGTVLYVSIGAALTDLAAAVGGEREKSPVEMAFLIVGIAITFFVVWYVAKVAKRELDKALGTDAAETDASLAAAVTVDGTTVPQPPGEAPAS